MCANLLKTTLAYAAPRILKIMVYVARETTRMEFAPSAPAVGAARHQMIYCASEAEGPKLRATNLANRASTTKHDIAERHPGAAQNRRDEPDKPA